MNAQERRTNDRRAEMRRMDSRRLEARRGVDANDDFLLPDVDVPLNQHQEDASDDHAGHPARKVISIIPVIGGLLALAAVAVLRNL